MDTNALRQQLLQRREEIVDRLGRVTRDSRHTGKLDADSEEQAIELENDEVLASLGASIRAEIANIDEAVGRIDSGNYGVCLRCRKHIPSPRLKALPYATRCVECEGAH
jgi:RNA polymerase-binding protein DksA